MHLFPVVVPLGAVCTQSSSLQLDAVCAAYVRMLEAWYERVSQMAASQTRVMFLIVSQMAAGQTLLGRPGVSEGSRLKVVVLTRGLPQ